MKNYRFLLIPIFVLGTFMTGCDANDDTDGVTMVNLKIQPVVNGSPLSSDLSTTYDFNGTNVSFSSARVYVTEFELVRADGTTEVFTGDSVTAPAKDLDGNDVTHTVTDRVILAKHDLGDDVYSLGDVPSGEYTSVKFKLGVTGLSNRLDASQVPASHPLSKQTDRNNHWNWNAGYQFLRLDGLVDTDADDVPDEVWEVHLGTGNFLKEVELSHDIDLVDGKNMNLHIMIDYGKLMANVDLTDPDQRLCHTNDNLPVANKVFAKYDDALMFHGVHDM